MENISCEEALQSEEYQLLQLQNENRQMRDEFNLQRAKMKDLFLQKEAECKKLTSEIGVIRDKLNEAKSQIIVDQYERDSEQHHRNRRTEEEITSLQKLVQDTIEELSYSKSEIGRLTDELEKLQHNNAELRQKIHSQQQDTPSLVPVISHVKKTIARKLGAESGNNDCLEDSMRKVNKYALEDAEVLRSLVVPLEEEINALKEKLRTTDEELQNLRMPKLFKETIQNESKIQVATATLTPTVPLETLPPCKCSDNLVESEKEIVKLKQNFGLQQKDVERLREELERETILRSALEEQWQEKRELYKNEVQQLTENVTSNERELSVLQCQYNGYKEELNNELRSITAERENIYRYMQTLQDDNEYLAGKYLATSEELENQRIDLPNSVDELQEMLLKCHENLIKARVGCEFEQKKCVAYLDEAQVLRDQLNSYVNERHNYERESTHRIKILESQLKHRNVENERLNALKEIYEKKEEDAQRQASELRLQVIEFQESNDKLEKMNKELILKINVLQQELGNSEAVQKDFVRLSQSLQMELEKIRDAETTVRWQDEDDIENCPTCKSNFTVTRRKLNCLHCGTIYCEKCITKTVSSAHRKRSARVCDVCHTLLVRHTAPYFSQAPPQSPT